MFYVCFNTINRKNPTILNVSKIANKLKAEADKKADKILADANSKAQAIIDSARQ